MGPGTTSLRRFGRRSFAAGALVVALGAAAVPLAEALRVDSIDDSFFADQQAVRGERTQIEKLPPAPPYCAATKVFVIGDSLTVGTEQFASVSTLFAASGYTATFDASIAKFSSAGATTIEARAAAGTLESAVMVALGTNDAAAGYTTASFAINVDRIMAAVGTSRVVVWVNLQMADMDTANRFNGVLYLKSLQYSNLLIADWANTANLQYLASDGLHYSTTGYKNRAAFMVDRMNWGTCRLLPF